MNTYISYVTLLFRDRRGAASIRHRNRATTVLMCEQKPYPVWSSWRRKIYPVYCEHSLMPSNSLVRAIFVWPWNENARTLQKQQTNGNRAIWLVYRMDTNARGFWLVKRTLGWKNFTSKNVLEINRYFALTSYCNTIGQSSNAFSILGFSLAGKRRLHVLIFLSIGWQNK